MQLKPKTGKPSPSADRPAPENGWGAADRANGAPAGMPLFLLPESPVQCKRNAGSSDDAAEVEADRMAGQALSSGAKPDAGSGSTPRPTSGEGYALPASTRQFFEGRFGADFGGVRVHTDNHADAAARGLGALAFTKGSDIAFRNGKYSPGASGGQKLLAHELAHVVQQRANGETRIQRQADPDKAKAESSRVDDFLLNYANEVAADLRRGIMVETFSLGSPYLNWAGDGEEVFKAAAAGQMFPGGYLRDELGRALAPMADSQISRIAGRALVDDQSETAVPAVAFELAPYLKAKIAASLQRIVPRYLAARNQTIVSSSSRHQASREPVPDQVVTSAPVDEAVVAGLLSGVTDFDDVGYRNFFAKQAQPLGDLGIKSPGNISFLAAQGMPQWVRAGNKDATAEDVAALLYGSSSLAYKLVAAPPLFGIDPASLVEEPYRRLWRESLAEAGLGPLSALAGMGLYPVASPLNQAAGSALQDEVVLGQAKALAPTGATQMEVVQQMRLALGIADQLVAGAGKFGLAGMLTGMRGRLDARSKKFAAPEEAGESQAWGAQVAKQYEILNGASAGLTTAVTDLDSYGGGEIPDFIHEPLRHMAESYVEAASLSEFADAGEQKLAASHELSQAYGTDVLDGAMRVIYDSLQAITSDAAENMGGNTAALVAQEKALRSELAQARSLIQENPKRVTELVEELQKKVNKLSNRVGVLNTLNSIDSLAEALRNHVTNINSTPSAYAAAGGMPGPIFGPSPDDWKTDAAKPYEKAVASLKEFRAIWAPVAKTAFSGTDEELAQQVKSASARSADLRATLDNAIQLAKGAEDFDRMFAVYRTFLIGLALALVTFGVGELVTGVAVGAGMAEGGAGVFLLSTTGEALTMTALNAAIVGKEGWQNFGTDLIWNFLTMGAMKGVARLYRGVIGAAAAKTGLGAAGEFTVTILAGALPALAKAEYDTHKKLGRWMTDEEAHGVVRDSILQGIALAIGMRVAGEFLPNFRETGMKFGGRLKALRQARATLHADVQKAATAEPVNEATVEDLEARDTALIERETKLIEEAAASPNVSAEAKADLEKARLAAGAAAEAAEVRKVLPYIEEAGENQFVCAQGHLDDAKAFYGKPHPPAPPEPLPGPVSVPAPAPPAPAKPPAVTEMPPDEVTHARKIRVEPSDGSPPFTVTEKVTPDNAPAVASAQPADAAVKPPETPASPFKTLDDILTADRTAFRDDVPAIKQKYQEYADRQKKLGKTVASPEEWAATWTRGSGQAELEKILGPDFRAQGDAKYMVDLNNFGRPEGLTDAKIEPLWARIVSREAQFRAKLRNMISEGIKAGKINVGYFYNCKGLVAEILSEGYQQSVLAERQKLQPDARLLTNVYVRRGGTGDPVLFTDNLIGVPGPNGLEISDRFEVKSGASGGEQAQRQHFEWVENRMEDGTKLLLNRRPAVAGETLTPGRQERIGNMVYDVYYWKPKASLLRKNPQLRTVSGLSGAGSLHAIMPEGANVLGAGSGDRTVDIKVQTLPATASEINYLARLMIERVAPQSSAAPPGSAAAGAGQ